MLTKNNTCLYRGQLGDLQCGTTDGYCLCMHILTADEYSETEFFDTSECDGYVRDWAIRPDVEGIMIRKLLKHKRILI